MSRDPRGIVEANDSDAVLRDAMRGVMWEEKWRGTLEDHPSPELLRSAARRWVPSCTESPILPPLPAGRHLPLSASSWPVPNRVGWGTYRWKYDLGLVREAIAGGAGLIDTAEGYGFGKVEKELGKVLEGAGATTMIATKVARSHLSHTATLSAGRRSRDNLRVGSIDLYQIHWPVPKLLPYTMDAMAELLEEGTIRRVGVSNFSSGQLLLAFRLARERGFDVASNQVRLNYRDRANLEYLIPFCVRLGVKVIAYSPLGQGHPLGSSVTHGEALRWVLSQPVDSVIPATNKLEHLRVNLRIGSGDGREATATTAGVDVEKPRRPIRRGSG